MLGIKTASAVRTFGKCRMNWLSQIGTVYNISGGALIAWALTTPPKWALRQQATTFWAGNKALFKVLILQRLDARFGLPLVLVGSTMQLVDGFGVHISAWLAIVPCLV